MVNVDKESGNQIPPGATANEVRDDVPIMASENEFVLPADVVRYLGLDKIQKMVAKAKEDMAAMMNQQNQQQEQAANKQAPQAPDNPAPVASPPQAQQSFAEGGVVTSGLPQDSGFTGAKEYVNSNGNVMFVSFMNGKPLFNIPEGYTEKGTSQVSNTAPSGSGSVSQSYNQTTKSDNHGERRDLPTSRLAGKVSDWTVDDFVNYGKQQNDPASSAIKGIVGNMPLGKLALFTQDKVKGKQVAEAFDQMLDTGYDLQGNAISDAQKVMLSQTREELKSDLEKQSGLNLSGFSSLGKVVSAVGNFLTGKTNNNVPAQATPEVSTETIGNKTYTYGGMPADSTGQSSYVNSYSGGNSQPGGAARMGSDLGRDPSSGPSYGSMSSGGLYAKGGLVTRKNKKC